MLYLNETMSQEDSIILFRSELTSYLLTGTDERVSIMAEVSKRDYLPIDNIEGVNLITEWESLFKTVTDLWQEAVHVGSPIIKVSSLTFFRIAFFLDFVATFFLYNGDKIDDKYLKDVGDFFKEYKQFDKERTDQELFNKAFKQ